VADTAGADSVALRLARRLRQAAPTGLTPFHRDAGALPRLLRAAEIAMLLGERDGLEPHELLTGSWRLLVHVAAEDAGQLDALVESTVGPAVAHDAGSGLGLIDTLRAYLARRANMRATAAAVYAHRHTVAARLDRIRELTGHDPQAPLGQQQLSLGLQALAVATAAAGVER
jgi:DNA-binding PucR family transcriptional regulator